MIQTVKNKIETKLVLLFIPYISGVNNENYRNSIMKSLPKEDEVFEGKYHYKFHVIFIGTNQEPRVICVNDNDQQGVIDALYKLIESDSEQTSYKPLPIPRFV